MKRIVGWMVLILILALSTSVVAGGPNLNPGKWEITTKIEMPGMPMQMPAIKTTQCLTKDDYIMKEPPSPGKMGTAENPCKVTKSEVKGDTVIWGMVCEGQQITRYHGEMTYHGDTMEGFLKITQGAKGQPPMTLKMKGKRIGPCDQ